VNHVAQLNHFVSQELEPFQDMELGFSRCENFHPHPNNVVCSVENIQNNHHFDAVNFSPTKEASAQEDASKKKTSSLKNSPQKAQV
jgi:hypothetical protein